LFSPSPQVSSLTDPKPRLALSFFGLTWLSSAGFAALIQIQFERNENEQAEEEKAKNLQFFEYLGALLFSVAFVAPFK
jgi:hypothetical protein